MLSQRQSSIVVSCSLMAMLLLQFQNCAPATSVGATSGGTVKIVDEFNKVDLQFALPQVQLHDEAPQAVVDGLCPRARQGQMVDFGLRDPQTGAEVVRGSALCERGSFKVALVDLEPVVCGSKYRLHAQGEWGSVAETEFERRCQPLAAELKSHDGASECRLELNSDRSCRRVCYRADTVMIETEVEASQCQALADRLAGP